MKVAVQALVALLVVTALVAVVLGGATYVASRAFVAMIG